MDYDGVVASPQVRPFLLYIGGVAWCPYCVVADRFLFDTEAFRQATADMPLVMLDNRRRGEQTGPSLLHAPAYLRYLQDTLSPAPTEGELEAMAQEKLAANRLVQTGLATPGATTISYPTLLLCQSDGKGGMRVVSRLPPGLSPNASFEQNAADTLAKLTALLEDPYEEDDNWAERQPAELSLADQDLTSPRALLGGLDSADWRRLDCQAPANWQIRPVALEEESGALADPAATLLLTLYDENRQKLDSQSGTWQNPPELLFNAVQGTKRLLCLEIIGQGIPVPYALECRTSLPPYELRFPADTLDVAGQDGKATVQVLWRRLDPAASGLVAKATLELPEGVQCLQGTELAVQGESGTLELKLTGLLQGQEESAVPVESLLALVPRENCRIAAPQETLLRLYTLPALPGHAPGETVTVSLAENQAQSLSFPCLSGYEDVRVEAQGLPLGVTLAVNPETGALEVSGKPLASGSFPVTVTLKTGDGKEGATYTFLLEIRPLADQNPVAAHSDAFTGRVTKTSGLCETVALLTLQRKDHRLAATIQAPPALAFSLEDWSLTGQDGTVSATATTPEGTLALALTADGQGSGTLSTAQGKEYAISFAPNLTQATQEDYLGLFHVAISTPSLAQDAPRGYGFLQIQVKEDGTALVLPNGRLPDGTLLSSQEIALTRYEGQDATLNLYLTTAEGSVLGGPLALAKANSDSEATTRLSACTDLYWSRPDNTLLETDACGVVFDPERDFWEQLKGSAQYTTLNFSAIFDYPEQVGTQLCPTPEGLFLQAVPTGIPLAESTRLLRGFQQLSLEPDLPDGKTMLPGVDLLLEITQDGRLEGSFALFPAATGTPETVEIHGIFTPYPASCCDGGPDAVAYGHFLYQGRSWPVRIIPDHSADTSAVRPLPLLRPSMEQGVLRLSWEKPEGELGALFDRELGLPLDLSLEGSLPAPKEGGLLCASVVRHGVVALPTQEVPAYRQSTLSATLTEEAAQALPQGGWLCLALPEGFRLPMGLDLSRPPLHCLAPSGNAFIPWDGQSEGPAAFFLHLAPGQTFAVTGLQPLSQEAQEETPLPGGGYRLVPAGEAQEGQGDIWHWAPLRQAFLPGLPDASPLTLQGFLQGVWYKPAGASTSR